MGKKRKDEPTPGRKAPKRKKELRVAVPGSYRCPQCAKVLPDCRSFHAHRAQTGHGCMRCCVCDKWILSVSARKKHEKTEHHLTYSGTLTEEKFCRLVSVEEPPENKTPAAESMSDAASAEPSSTTSPASTPAPPTLPPLLLEYLRKRGRPVPLPPSTQPKVAPSPSKFQKMKKKKPICVTRAPPHKPRPPPPLVPVSLEDIAVTMKVLAAMKESVGEEDEDIENKVGEIAPARRTPKEVSAFLEETHNHLVKTARHLCDTQRRAKRRREREEVDATGIREGRRKKLANALECMVNQITGPLPNGSVALLDTPQASGLRSVNQDGSSSWNICVPSKVDPDAAVTSVSTSLPASPAIIASSVTIPLHISTTNSTSSPTPTAVPALTPSSLCTASSSSSSSSSPSSPPSVSSPPSPVSSSSSLESTAPTSPALPPPSLSAPSLETTTDSPPPLPAVAISSISPLGNSTPIIKDIDSACAATAPSTSTSASHSSSSSSCSTTSISSETKSAPKIKSSKEKFVRKKCYMCKTSLRGAPVHHFYDQMCVACGDFNYEKRLSTSGLKGLTALVTGARVKIGYEICLKLLRAGAKVLATTRFPRDCARRFAREADYEEWRKSLHIFELDMRFLGEVSKFADEIAAKWCPNGLHILINNAAQTIRRPPVFYQHLLAGEATSCPLLVEQTVVKLNFTHHTLSSEPAFALLDTMRLQSTLDSTTMTENGKLLCKSGQNDTQVVVMEGEAVDLPHSSQLQFAPEDNAHHYRVSEFPQGVLDADLQQVDLRSHNTWVLEAPEVHSVELVEVHCVNSLGPFILTNRLYRLLRLAAALPAPPLFTPCGSSSTTTTTTPTAATSATSTSSAPLRSRPSHPPPLLKESQSRKFAYRKHPFYSFVVNVSSMEGKFTRNKQTTHPHTNMSKASLNMFTRTSARQFARDGILMNSVDTGWVTDEYPRTAKQRAAFLSAVGLHPPLDEVDGAARVLDPVFSVLNHSRPIYGGFFKEYKPSTW